MIHRASLKRFEIFEEFPEEKPEQENDEEPEQPNLSLRDRIVRRSQMQPEVSDASDIRNRIIMRNKRHRN
jgi:hypothetical protein